LEQGEANASLQYDVSRLSDCLDRVRLRLVWANFEDRRPFQFGDEIAQVGQQESAPPRLT
jgi:hypothetical protein